MLSLPARCCALRRQEPALQLGDWRLLAADEAVLAYERRWEGRRCTVLLNLTPEPRTFPLGPEPAARSRSRPGAGGGEGRWVAWHCSGRGDHLALDLQ